MEKKANNSRMPLDEKRLKVLLFDNDDFSDYTTYFARGLSKYVDVILYSFSRESPKITGAINQKGIKFIYIDKRFPKGYSSIKGIIRVLILYFILFDALLRTKYDIVHIQDYLPAFFLFIPLLKLRRKRICWTIHDLDIFCLWDRLFASGLNGRLQIVFRKLVTQPKFTGICVDRILVHSLSHKQKLLMKKIEEKKISVIKQLDYQYLLEIPEDSPHSVDLELKENSILFFGNIAPWKGIETLVEAARIVKEKIGPVFNLVIAGKAYPGFDGNDFFGNINKENLEYVKIINRYIKSSEIPALFRKSSFLVLPYYNQFEYSSSGVIPLSYTFSKPVITSNVPSLAEYVEHQKTGFVFEEKDSIQLANYMIELVENNSKTLDMGEFAYQKLVTEMSLDKSCRDIHEIYKSLIE